MTLEAYPEYIQGFIKRCHYECFIPDEEYAKLKDNKKVLGEYIEEHGDLLVDDWYIDDVGPIDDIEIYNT